MSERPISIVVIKGSVRPGNYTSMAAAIVVDELSKNDRVSVEVVDPSKLKLPPPGVDGDSPDAARLKEMVSQATGVILVTPEYHGSFSSVMKLVIENLGFPSVLSGKPVALLGVAAGSIGAIKSLEHLRGVVSHIGGLALPLPVSVANVQHVFDKDGRILEPQVEKMIRAVPLNLLSFIDRHICPRVTLERILREGMEKASDDVMVA
jgi:chromate reductase